MFCQSTRSRRSRATAPRIVTIVAALSLVALSACTDGPAPSSGGDAGAQPGGSNTTGVDLNALTVDQAAAGKLPERVKQAKKVTVVMNVSSAPTKFRAEDNTTIVGLNPDIAQALGKLLGVEVAIEDVQFDGIIPGLQSKRYDMAVSSMAPSAERIKVLDMVRYGAWGTSLAVQQGNAKKLDTKNLCGSSVAVQQGSIQHTQRLPDLSNECTKAGKPAINQVVLPDQTAAILQLTTGRIDAVLADSPILAWAAKQRPGTIELVDEMNKGAVDIALPKDSDLTPAVQAAMQNLIQRPEYKQIYAKWGMDNTVVTEAVKETGSA